MLARLLSQDAAVTEVIGYVLSFALSAIFLLISLSVFDAARGNTDHVVTGVELRTIADRVAGRIVEMGLVSQEFPNATMDVTLVVPQSLDGTLYTVVASKESIRVSTDDGALSATATTYKSEALPNIDITGSVGSSNERVHLHYELLANNSRQIQIRGE